MYCSMFFSFMSPVVCLSLIKNIFLKGEEEAVNSGIMVMNFGQEKTVTKGGHAEMNIGLRVKSIHYTLSLVFQAVLFKQTMQTQMKCRIMRHFIWVFSV